MTNCKAVEGRRFHDVAAAGTLQLDLDPNRHCLPRPPRHCVIVNAVHSDIQHPLPASGYALVPRTGHCPDLARPGKQCPEPGSSHRLVSQVISTLLPWVILGTCRAVWSVHFVLQLLKMHLLHMFPLIGPLLARLEWPASLFSLFLASTDRSSFSVSGPFPGLRVKTKLARASVLDPPNK